MPDGVRTNLLESFSAADSFIANRNQTTGLISAAAMIAMVVAKIGPTFEIRSELYADLDWPSGSVASVFNDADERNGVYKKSGASGSGSWTRIGPLPLNTLSQAVLDEKASVAALAQETADRIAADEALSAGTFFAGTWNAASGAFPATRSTGANVRAGDWFQVNAAGTVDGVTFAKDDRLRALVDSPSTTDFDDNWVRSDLEASLAPVNTRLTAIDYPVASFDALALLEDEDLPVGRYIFDTSTGFRYRRAPDNVSAHLDYSATGGINLYVETLFGWFNVKAFGAKGDGSTNDSAAIQAAIDAVGPDGGTVYFPVGHYRIVTGLEVKESYTRLLGNGYGSYLRLSGSASASTKMIEGNKASTGAAMRGVSIRGLRLNGVVETANWPKGQEYECVNFKNTEDFDFQDNWVEGAGQDGLDLDGFNRRATIRGNVFYRCRMQAVHLYGGDHSEVKGNWIIDCGWDFIDGTTAENTGVIDTPFDPALQIGHLHSGTEINDNFIINCATGIHFLASTKSSASGNYIFLDENHTFTTVGMAIWASDVAPGNEVPVLTICQNVIIGPFLHGIRAVGNISNNYLEGIGTLSTSAAIHTRPGKISQSSENEINGCTGHALWYVGPTLSNGNVVYGTFGNDYARTSHLGSKFVNDTFRGTTSARGINLIFAGEVYHCEVEGFGTYGIRAEGANAAGSIIVANKVDGKGTATEFGIQAVSGAHRCRISQNSVKGITSSNRGAVGILSSLECTMDANESYECYWSMVIGAGSDGYCVVGNISRNPINILANSHIIVSGTAGTRLQENNYEIVYPAA